ncbi:MAG: hypothetical protein WCF69_05675, partial [Mycobacterium sp.]
VVGRGSAARAAGGRRSAGIRVIAPPSSHASILTDAGPWDVQATGVAGRYGSAAQLGPYGNSGQRDPAHWGVGDGDHRRVVA